MTDTTFSMSLDGEAGAIAVIIGTNEIASAVAVQLARRCHRVIPPFDVGARMRYGVMLGVTLALPSSLRWTAFRAGSPATERSRRRAITLALPPSPMESVASGIARDGLRAEGREAS